MVSRPTEHPLTVVVATRDRRASLLRTLEHLTALPERPPLIVVDNGSRDGTCAAVRERFPRARLVAAGRNLGGSARTVGARLARTPLVAFADDDSWWEPGSLALASDTLRRHRSVGLVAARVLVGPEGCDDPVSIEMAGSPLAGDGLPGRRVLGFLACAAVVRRGAFLAAGGFHSRLGVGGEETLLALDLAAHGWALVYLPGAVVRHHPSAARDVAHRRRIELRNALWTAWLRRSRRRAFASTVSLARSAATDGVARAALAEALAGVPWTLTERRRIAPTLEREFRRLEFKNQRRAATSASGAS